MKSSINLILTIIVLLPLSFGSEVVDQLLAALAKKPTPENMAEIGLKLRGAGKYAPDSERFIRIQTTLLSIPGHADFYVEPILESYRAFRDPTHPKHTGSMDWFSSEARYGFGTLKHLPSPETVRVLGDMLWEEWRRKPSPGSSVLVPSALAHQALWALLDLPLRNKPTEHFERYETEDYLPAWQDWYEKVKAGEIPFSFVGQSVEYRFQPDGSVTETPIEIPEEERNEVASDTPREPAEKPAQEPAKEQDTTSSEEPSSWLWIAITALLSGSLIAWLSVRRRNG